MSELVAMVFCESDYRVTANHGMNVRLLLSLPF